MKATGILLAGAFALALAGTAGAQQTTQPQANAQNPAVYGSPGMQSGGGYLQEAPNGQRGYPQGGQMVRGSYSRTMGRNGLTPVNHIPGKNPFGVAAKGGGARALNTGATPGGALIHKN